MRGIILGGGLGTRLYPLTSVTNKHLLPVYNKPMIHYPIETLRKAGIKDIAIVVSGKNPGQFIEILKNGEEFGLNSITYLFQEKPDGGIADGLALTEKFSQGESVMVILGDNCLDADQNFLDQLNNFESGARVFLKAVPNAKDFGCPRFENNRVVEIIEKPISPPSNYAVIGLYLYDNKIYDYIRMCKPSARNQLEISDCNNFYLQNQTLDYQIVDFFWQDAGTFDNLFLVNKYWYEKHHGSS